MDREQMLADMKEVLKIQGYDGNWDYDEYMHGMYNGMELMLSIAEEREPNYKEAPKEWVKDKPMKLEVAKQEVERLPLNPERE
jgi:hypothetical protein